MIPRVKSFDSSIALLRDPYRFVSRTGRQLGSDAFRGRLMLKKTLFLCGPEGAALFYDSAMFQRKGAMPKAVQRTLVGVGGVQTRDGEEHRRRKAMLLDLTTGERIDELVRLVKAEWEIAAGQWARQDSICLYEELHPLLTRAVCAWADVPLPEQQVAKRARQLRALFDQAAAKGPGHIRSRLARRQAERWLAGLIGQVRSGELRPRDDSPLAVIARFGEAGLDDPRIAAVELLNLLRPTVAIAVYIVFIAHALEAFPEQRPNGQQERRHFVQEVRRYYPFFPALTVLAREEFEWRGERFAKGLQVMLDLHGTSRHPASWDDPDDFRPGRFDAAEPGPFQMVPQGGGEHAHGHRCPGEWITIAVMEAALEFLTDRMEYDLPPQELEIDYGRMPALPRSRIIMRQLVLK